MKRYDADSDKYGQWFVYDNEFCYCRNGPMSEHEATSMAIQLNKEDKQMRQKEKLDKPNA